MSRSSTGKIANCSIAAALVAAFYASTASVASAEMLEVEKDELKLGFIKLTDMAPLAIAYEKGFF
jgi:nitrate/nitrite transport system substrate-binding protein